MYIRPPLGFRASTRFSSCDPCPSKARAVGTSVAVIIVLIFALIVLYAIVLRTDRKLLEAEKALDKQTIEWDHVYGVAGALYESTRMPRAGMNDDASAPEARER